jgi:hypothetical protein
LKNGGLKREGRAQTEKRGPSVSEAGNVIETDEHAGDSKEAQRESPRRCFTRRQRNVSEMFKDRKTKRELKLPGK